MPVGINVIDILNSEHQLNALPVGESISILLTDDPDLVHIKDYVSIVRIESDQYVPQFSDIMVHKITGESEYSSIDYDAILLPSTSEHAGFPLSRVLEIRPKEILSPNSNYYLIITKDFPPLSYEIIKTVSLGGSQIYVDLTRDGIGEDALFEIVVTTQSNLSSSQHVVGLSLYKDTVLVGTSSLNIRDKASRLVLNDALSVGFNSNVPFLLGETFSIGCASIQRLGSNKSQLIKTHVDAAIIESPEITSARIGQQEILDYYASMNLGAVAQEQTEQGLSPITHRFVYPNKIYIEFSKDLNVSTINLSTFSLDISQAFGNYHLGDMGMYSDTRKYVVTQRIINSKTISLEINEDTGNIVPLGQAYIIVGV
jgi:hypothetical protein